MLKIATTIAVAAVLASTAAFAEDAHHPAGSEAAPAPAPQVQVQPGQPMGGMTMGGGMMGQGAMTACPMMGQGQGGMMGGQGMADMAGHIDGHVAFLKAELKITAAQEKEWAAFAEALRAIAATMPRMSGVAASASPLAQLFDQKERLLASRLENFKRLHTAWAKLEAALTSEQRQSAQQLLEPRLMML